MLRWHREITGEFIEDAQRTCSRESGKDRYRLPSFPDMNDVPKEAQSDRRPSMVAMS